MAVRDLVVVGASAGGIEAMRAVAAALPADLPAAVCVVVHTPAGGQSSLAAVLTRSGPLPAVPARSGDPLEPGRIYVAVPDHHLLVRDGTVLLSRSARQNRVRPAVDPLFRSAARWYGPRAVGVVLSGALDDGAAGLAAIRAMGGTAVIQDPADAIFPGMPRAALAAVDDPVVGPASRLGATVADLVRQPVEQPAAAPASDLILETDMAELDHLMHGAELPGRPVALGCPECTGGMNAVQTGGAVHYRCHVGHSYSPQTLLAAQREKTESALWTAVSVLEEQAAIHQYLAARAAASGAALTVRHQKAAAQEVLRAAETIRKHFPALHEIGDPSRH